MAADQNRRSKKHKLTTITCFSFKGCFGSKPHEKQGQLIDTPKSNVDEELVKYGAGRRVSSGQDRAKTVPISPIPTLTSSSLAVGSCKEIDHVVDEVVETSGDHHLVTPQFTNNKVHDMVKNNKNLNKSSRAMVSIKPHKNSTTSEIRTSPAKLSHSISLLPPQPKREKSTAGGGYVAKNGSESIKSSDQCLDPMVGAIIMTVTLIVMLIWGKLCAVICTAAWFYIVPRFRANNNHILNVTNNDILNVNKLKNIDVDSWEYKKKVVLEGLLERY